ADPYVVRQRGVDFIRTAVPEEGIVVEPMPTAIFAQAQHPNAAKLWIEFLRSHEGQIVFSTYEGRSPGRSGVPSPDPNSIPAADTIKGLPVDLRAIAQDTALIQQSQAEFRSLF